MRRSITGLLLVAMVVMTAIPLGANEVRVIGGSGKSTISGDQGPAIDAGIGGPFGLTIGPDSALYVCETLNHCVRRIDDRTGLITTVAGSGKRGYDGDKGPATKALCNEPYEVKFDSAGNMYFVEMQNHLVRKIDAATNAASTVAGTGLPGFSGDEGPATAARLKQPHSIAFDGAGSLYIADIGNHRIRRVDLQSGIIETVAGTGERNKTPDGAAIAGTPLDGPRAIDFDTRGRMYLALREGNAVFRLDFRVGKLLHLAGTGRKGFAGDGQVAQKAQLNGPKGIAVGPGGDVYLADTENHVIRVVRAGTGKIETIVGDGAPGDGPDGPALRCRLNKPHGICVDHQGNVYIGDSSNNRVRKLTISRQ
jgi:DNA-binding beta-propeller fold protein YncE